MSTPASDSCKPGIGKLELHDFRAAFSESEMCTHILMYLLSSRKAIAIYCMEITSIFVDVKTMLVLTPVLYFRSSKCSSVLTYFICLKDQGNV